MIIALAMLLALTTGMAMAVSVCPFPNESNPQQFNPDDAVMASTFNVNLAGSVVGFASGSESALMETSGNLNKEMSYTNEMMADHGTMLIAKQTAATQDGLNTEIGTQNAIDFVGNSFGGAASGEESYLVSMASDAGGDVEASGFVPFCEVVGGDANYYMNQGAVASQLAMQQFAMETLPLTMTYEMAVGPASGGSVGAMDGSIGMHNYIDSVQGTPVNGTEAFSVAAHTQYDFKTTMMGDINTAYQFNYQSTHGTSLPAGFVGGKIPVTLPCS